MKRNSYTALHNVLRKILPLIALIIVATANGAQAHGMKTGSPEYIASVREIQGANTKAEEQLARELYAAAKKLMDCMRISRQVPQDAYNAESYTAAIKKVVGNNPLITLYQPTVSDSDNPAPSLSKCPIKVIMDFKMNTKILDELNDKAPEDWRETPGTIVIVSNGYNLCLIWAAGSNFLPLVNQQTKKLRYYYMMI